MSKSETSDLYKFTYIFYLYYISLNNISLLILFTYIFVYFFKETAKLFSRVADHFTFLPAVCERFSFQDLV